MEYKTLSYFSNKEFVLTGVDREMLLDSNETFKRDCHK